MPVAPTPRALPQDPSCPGHLTARTHTPHAPCRLLLRRHLPHQQLIQLHKPLRAPHTPRRSGGVWTPARHHQRQRLLLLLLPRPQLPLALPASGPCCCCCCRPAL